MKGSKNKAEITKQHIHIWEGRKNIHTPFLPDVNFFV